MHQRNRRAQKVKKPSESQKLLHDANFYYFNTNLRKISYQFICHIRCNVFVTTQSAFAYSPETIPALSRFLRSNEERKNAELSSAVMLPKPDR